MGRSGDICGLANDLHTGVGPHRSGPHGGCGGCRWTSSSRVPGGLDAIGDTIRLGQNGAVAQMGRSGGTTVCGLTCVLHTGAGQCRSGRSAIP